MRFGFLLYFGVDIEFVYINKKSQMCVLSVLMVFNEIERGVKLLERIVNKLFKNNLLQDRQFNLISQRVIKVNLIQSIFKRSGIFSSNAFRTELVGGQWCLGLLFLWPWSRSGLPVWSLLGFFFQLREGMEVIRRDLSRSCHGYVRRCETADICKYSGRSHAIG